MSAPSGRVDVAAAARCPGCAALVAAGDRFCEVCGTDLGTSRSTSPPLPATTAGCPHCGHRATADADPADGYCPSCGLRLPDGTDHVEVAVAGAAAVSDRGHVRPRNEDAVALGRGPGPRGPVGGPVAAVVCDGVSSVPGSERAARAAADATLEHLLRTDARDGGEGRIRAAVAAGAAAAADLAPAGRDAPSCTLVCGLVDLTDSAAPVVTVGWAGDSRAYWLAAGSAAPARLLTADHVAATAPPGMLDPVVVAARPDAITRWLGAGSDAEPDVVTLTPAGPGALLLCTDGLWKYLPDAAALSALALPALYDGGPPTAATALTAAALAAGGEDNVTVAVVPVSPVPVPGAVDRATDPATVPLSRSSS